MGKKKNVIDESFISSTEEVKEELAADVAAEAKDPHEVLYRPSNGTEGESFQCAFCERCTKDDPEADICCDILTRSAAFGIDDPEYPREWTYGDAGQPVCTAFEGKVVDAEFVSEEPVPVGEGGVTTPFTSDGNQDPYVTRDPDKISPTFTRELPVPVPAEEMAEYAKEQARLYGVREKAIADKKASTAAFNRLVKDTEQRLLQVSQVVEEGTEERPTVCRWEFDYSCGIKKLRRLDNHQIVCEETLQGDELHMSFNFNGSSEAAVEKLAEVQAGNGAVDTPLADDPPEETAATSHDPSIVDINAEEEPQNSSFLTEDELAAVNSELAEAGAEEPSAEPEAAPKEKGAHACKVCGFDTDNHVYLVRHLRDIHALKLSEYKAQYSADK